MAGYVKVLGDFDEGVSREAVCRKVNKRLGGRMEKKERTERKNVNNFKIIAEEACWRRAHCPYLSLHRAGLAAVEPSESGS